MVDDHPARLLTYEAILSGMPVQFARAHSGEEGLQLLLKQSFALILLDVNMPGMDGFEMARHIRSLSRLEKTPIIFVTGERLTDLDRLKGYEVGAIDYISVPVVPEILRSKVAVLIELYNRRAEFERLSEASLAAKLEADRPRQNGGASAAQLRAMFDHSTDLEFILSGERDAEGVLTTWRYVDANASALRAFGCTREALIGRSVQEVFPGRAPRAIRLCQQALLGGEPLQHEAQFDGRHYWVRMFAVDAQCVAVNCTDITERKQAEMALANSERRFQALLDCCPVGVAQTSLDGRFEYVNAGFCNLLGYTAGELLAMTWQQVTHPDDIEADQSRGEMVLAGTLPHFTLEKRYLRKDGTPVWVSMFGNFVFDEKRRPLQGVALAVDITARKMADLALHESRQRLLLAHEAAGIGSFDWNVNTDAASWDQRALDIWGFPAGLPVSLSTGLAGIHAEDRAAVQAAIERAMDPAGDGRYLATFRVINARDGCTRWVESRGQVLFAHGAPARLVGTFLEVTERVAAERSLRESEERFRELANHIDQIVWTCDAQGEPTWFNDRWYAFSGTTVAQMREEGWRGLVHPDHAARILEHFRRCVAAGESWEETFPILGRDGRYVWFLSRAIPIKDAAGRVLRWFGTSTDITSQRDLQEALTRADQRKDEFLAMLAHELRNPVAPIMSVASVLARKFRLDQQAAQLVAIVQRQASSLARLLDDLLDVARITRNRIQLRRERIDVHQCVRMAQETVAPLLEPRGQHIALTPAPAPLRVQADAVRITQCITNLLTNAAKYSDAGSTIFVRVAAREGCALIEVRDQGRGISADFLPHVFELFTQGAQHLHRESGGLGIGLSICKRLMEMHGGAISAASDGLGLGSTFTLTLPLEEHAVTAEDGPAPAAAAAPLRVLIVDDNIDAADSIALLLGLGGHQTRVVYGGVEALEVCAGYAPDVLLLDIGLPGIDGHGVIARLRQEGFRGYTIALSGYGQPEDRQRALQSGFDAHLVKPVEPDVLEQALEAARARRASTWTDAMR